ncbi:MAG: hypothetical protein QG673_528 [Pseudomonadota bacterium]|nr:hypothetical protein [Pseudomonadota bacterium]
MKKSLFVAGLDFAVTDDNLKELFATYGTVESAKVITDRYSGQSRGFAFVEMSSQVEAQSCIDNLNNTTYKNRPLVVKMKEDKPAASSQRKGFSRGW